MPYPAAAVARVMPPISLIFSELEGEGEELEGLRDAIMLCMFSKRAATELQEVEAVADVIE